jgi:hypothetical protein
VKAIFLSARKIPKAPILIALMATACSQGRITKVTPVTDTASFSAPRGGAWKVADSLWRSRRDAQKAWASLVAYRRAAEQQPKVAQLWTDYSHACYFLATYTEQNQRWSNPERSKGLYLEGARAAEAALYLHAEYRRKLSEGGDEAAAARALTGEWTEPAFWLAANRGRWALGEGRRTRMDGRDRFEALVRGIAARDPALYHGGPDRFLGVMFIAAPAPRADSARAHFDRAQAAGPLFFANRTLRAQYLSVFEKDSASFRALLEEVLRMPADTLPEAAVENAFEQAHARDLLSRQAELFP